MRKNLALLLRRFGASERGVAAVEFALILPFLLTLYFGSLEAASLFTVDKRINSVSATLGDLVSQWDVDEDKSNRKIPETTWNGYLAASTAIMAPYSTSGLSIIVSLVKVKSDGTTQVLWSQANTGTAKTVGQPYAGFAQNEMMNQVARGACIFASETSYSYKPLLGQVFTNALTLTHTNYFMPRFGSADTINLWNKSVADKTCTTA